MEIPTTQKAIVYDEPGKLSTKVTDLPVPEPGPGEVLINLTHSGVCHSDFSVMMSNWAILPFPTQKDQVGGHEGVGKIVKLGPGSEETGVKIGDRVGVKWIASACGRCGPCFALSDGLCRNAKVSGYYYPGTFQQYVIGPATYVTPIPDGLDSEQAAPMLCAGVTVLAAIKRAQIKAGDWLVIVGAGGGLGHLAVQLASKGMGYRVIGIDHGSKEALAKESGAEHFVDITKFPTDDKGEAIKKHVRELADGIGAHAAVVCTAVNPAFATALTFLRFNGTLVCVGIPEGEAVPIATASAPAIIMNQWRIVGSAVGTRQDAIETLDFARRGIVKAHVKVEKMDALNSVFEQMHEGKLQGRVVLDLA